MQTVAQLRSTFPRVGRLDFIGRASERGGPIESLEEIAVEEKTGLVGEHHATSGRSKRQVTLIQSEHLPIVAALVGRDSVDAAELRRNLAVSGIPVLALKDQRFRIGEVILEGSVPCEPCSKMEAHFGPGGYNAIRGHGGICAKVLRGGVIRVGDEVRHVSANEWNEIVAADA